MTATCGWPCGIRVSAWMRKSLRIFLRNFTGPSALKPPERWEPESAFPSSNRLSSIMAAGWKKSASPEKAHALPWYSRRMPQLLPMQKLLIVEDDQSVRSTMVTCLELEGYAVDAVASTREALDRLLAQPYPIVISDIYLDERTGLDVLHAARQQNPSCAVILMTGRGSMETVMAATEGGAFEYLAKPFEMSQMIETIKRAEKSFDGDEDDEAAAIDDLPDTEMIGSSPRMIEIYKTISKVAPTDATVLIEGETRTGKELIARMLHRNSKRAQQPFVPVDCGSIAPSLLQSELFGALKGAYTGANRDRLGVFEARRRDGA